MSQSYYLGPVQRNVPLATWGEVVSAAAAGVLDETQWVELKKDVPPSNRKTNLELARDLASLSLDGGVLVIGIEDAGGGAGAVVGTDSTGLATRISQVAGGTVTPPLSVAIAEVGDPQDPNRAVIVISVSASLDAPHMVDGSYWRRSAIGKAKLTDPEVRRLLLERERRKEGFEQRLARMRAEIDPTAVAIRRGSHLYLLLEPQTAVTGPPLHELLGTASQAFAAVSSARDGEQQFPPTFDSFTQAADHPDGYLFSSPDGGVSDGAGSDLLLRMLLGDDGSVHLVSGGLNVTDDDERFVSPKHVIEMTHHTLHVAAVIARERLGFNGQWRVGIAVDRLQGLRAYSADPFGRRRRPAFPLAEFGDSVTTTSEEMAENTPVVVGCLLSRFLRGLGAERLAKYSVENLLTLY